MGNETKKSVKRSKKSVRQRELGDLLGSTLMATKKSPRMSAGYFANKALRGALKSANYFENHFAKESSPSALKNLPESLVMTGFFLSER
ncbi:hypothetical protein N9036_02415 [Akkermansiaceae bacterium]|nr:hypothetical protein [Akkermansiaceae bacterium]